MTTQNLDLRNRLMAFLSVCDCVCLKLVSPSSVTGQVWKENGKEGNTGYNPPLVPDKSQTGLMRVLQTQDDPLVGCKINLMNYKQYFYKHENRTE